MKSLLRPSYHSGQLSEMSLFCGQTFVPPTALAATFHWQPSCRPSQWQKPHDFWPSSEYEEEKNQRRPTSSSVAKRFWPRPPVVGSGVDGVTPTGVKPCRVKLPFESTFRNETRSEEH